MNTTAAAILTMQVAPGCSGSEYRIISATATNVTAVCVNYEAAKPETFTRRKNGHFARKGEGQWSCYLRGTNVAAALMRAS